ncbi:MAG: DoxX family protein [Gammaproteobacteria bacterium]|nr:DoxX family protein [Gammaproteobacteria bacterium]
MNTLTHNSAMRNELLNQLSDPPTATFILRVTLGMVLLAHSLYLKLMVFTLPGTAQFFVSIGLPGMLAYAVFGIEVVAGIALVLGIKTRLFSALVIPVLLGATWAHSSNGWLFTNGGGGWEYPLILTVMAIVQAGLGNGKFAISSEQN